MDAETLHKRIESLENYNAEIQKENKALKQLAGKQSSDLIRMDRKLNLKTKNLKGTGKKSPPDDEKEMEINHLKIENDKLKKICLDQLVELYDLRDHISEKIK